jgi:hypothetical protein
MYLPEARRRTIKIISDGSRCVTIVGNNSSDGKFYKPYQATGKDPGQAGYILRYRRPKYYYV